MGITIATTSGKGGTGKSTITAGLALSFAKMNKTVLLVDMDEGLRCLDLFLGVDDSVVFDLSDILAGRDIADAMYTSPYNPLINVIPAPAGVGKINHNELAQFAARVKQLFEVVIFDFPAGMDFSLYRAIGEDARFLAVCNPDPISVRDAAAVCAALPRGKYEPRLILNRFDIAYIKKGIYSNVDSIIDTSGFRLLGIIPQSSELMLLPINHSLKPSGKPQKALIRVARRLLGEEIRLPKAKRI